ncbi:MAG TPA: hypothetical protein VL360_01505 [Gammaproteobacteria bacterium]|jgi:hypothetical protein|nr:hypothetical protein [Gammaproteobacteria bacterium]
MNIHHKIKIVIAFAAIAALSGCASNIQPVGYLGPNKLRVFVIKNNDFLSSSRMLVILDKKGNVSAYSGNTVNGAGFVAMQAAETVVSAGALVVGAQAIEHGLENTKIKGIPNSVRVKTDNVFRSDNKVKVNAQYGD